MADRALCRAVFRCAARWARDADGVPVVLVPQHLAAVFPDPAQRQRLCGPAQQLKAADAVRDIARRAFDASKDLQVCMVADLA